MSVQETMDGSPSIVEVFSSNKFKAGIRMVDQQTPPWIRLKFQAGPLQEVGVNGCSVEDVIDVLVTRLEGFQKGPFRCRENALAITKLEEAKQWLLYRTSKRQEQGVEGTNAAHQS